MKKKFKNQDGVEYKFYVYFYRKGQRACHCFEDEYEQAQHFASLVNGEVLGYRNGVSIG